MKAADLDARVAGLADDATVVLLAREVREVMDELRLEADREIDRWMNAVEGPKGARS